MKVNNEIKWLKKASNKGSFSRQGNFLISCKSENI